MKKTYVFACFCVLLLRCESPFEPFLRTRKKLVLELRCEITRWYAAQYVLTDVLCQHSDGSATANILRRWHKNQNDL